MKCLNNVFQKNLTKIALVDAESGIEMSYSDIEELRTSLLDIFPQPEGNLIFIQVKNTCISVATVLAILSSNNILCLIDPSMDLNTFNKYLSAFLPDVIISPSNTHGNIENFQCQDHPETNELKILCTDTNFTQKLPEELRLILPTSGSTGSLKFVKLTENNLTTNGHDICKAMGILPTDRAYAHLPLHYSYGLSVILSHALAGATSVISSASIVEKNFWQEIRNHKCNFFPGIPFHFDMLLKLGITRLKIPSVNKFSVAGGALDHSRQERLLEQITSDSDLFIMYGQTEASPRITTFNLQKNREKLGSVGQVIGSGKLLIDNVVGEIIFLGTSIMMGYASRRTDLYLPDQMNARLPTGDLGYIDDEGFLYITGRLKRIAKLSGLRLNLDDIEKHLSATCSCSVIEKENYLHIATDQLDKINLLKTNFIESYQIPGGHVKFHHLKNLPRLNSGKLDYQTLGEMI